MQIRYDAIQLDKAFPFALVDMHLAPYSDMGGWYHWHDCFEIAYIKSGTGCYRIENKDFSVGPGDIVIINDIEPHQLKVDDESLNQINIVFSPSLIWPGGGYGYELDFISPFFQHDAGFNNKIAADHPLAKEIIGDIEVLQQEYNTQSKGWQLMIKAKLLCLLTLLFRHFCAQKPAANDRKNRFKLKEAFAYIERQYAEDITLTQAAALVYLTPQYFSTLFKKVTQISFINYVVQTRVQHAAKLLSSTDQKVAVIAQDCGFHNLGNFNEAFKKYTGKTPTEYRSVYLE